MYIFDSTCTSLIIFGTDMDQSTKLLQMQHFCLWVRKVKYLKDRRQDLGGFLPKREPAKAWCSLQGPGSWFNRSTAAVTGVQNVECSAKEALWTVLRTLFLEGLCSGGAAIARDGLFNVWWRLMSWRMVAFRCFLKLAVGIKMDQTKRGQSREIRNPAYVLKTSRMCCRLFGEASVGYASDFEWFCGMPLFQWQLHTDPRKLVEYGNRPDVVSIARRSYM